MAWECVGNACTVWLPDVGAFYVVVPAIAIALGFYVIIRLLSAAIGQ